MASMSQRISRQHFPALLNVGKQHVRLLSFIVGLFQQCHKFSPIFRVF